MIYAIVLPLGALVLWSIVVRPGWAKAHATLLAFMIA